MSKSHGNVVAPDNLVAAYGADTVRAYIMFFARWELGAPWNNSGIDGTHRWLRRVWTSILEEVPGGNADKEVIRSLRRKTHQTLRSVTHDYENFEFNTIISSLMELLNEMNRAKGLGAWGTQAWEETVMIYILMLAPVAPHISEELWELTGNRYSVHQQAWPVLDEEAAAEDRITLVIQVNGKLRDRIEVDADITEETAKNLALSSEAIQKHLEGKVPRHVIYVPGRLVNIVL